MANETVTATTFQPYQEVATRAARTAGDLIQEMMGQTRAFRRKSSATDLVTDVDVAAEAAITALLQEQFPEVPILGEESGDRPLDSSLNECPELWVVDPLDGTTNFVQGVPLVAVNIAYVRYGTPVVGVTYAPLLEELYTATIGGGALLNGEPIRTTGCTTLRDAVAITDYPYGPEGLGRTLSQLQTVAPRVRSIRTFGSAAIHAAWVACGRIDAFWQVTLKPWDIAAGALLVQEAGGRTTALDGSPYRLDASEVVTAAPAVHAEFVRLLANQ